MHWKQPSRRYAELQPGTSFDQAGAAMSLLHTDVRPELPLALRRRPWHLIWFAGISAVSFLLPFLLTSVWRLQHDLYYLIYFVITACMLAAYVRSSGFDLAERFGSRRRSSLLVGLIAAAFVVWSVLARIEATPRPAGLYFLFEIFWRGAIYGVVDALLLSAFPGLVALGLMQSDISGLLRRTTYGVLTLLLVVFITVAYHVGYEELRDRDVVGPMLGNAVISMPVIATANPIGSIIAHTAMHLAAVTHAYESKDRLPPQVFVRHAYPRQ